jgi:polyhydroxybutyrate depolymerase
VQRVKRLVLCLLAACGGETERPLTFGGDRPVDLEVPAQLADGERYPLLLVLHGYTVNGFIQQAYLGVKQLSDSSEAFVLAPDGVPDTEGKPFWNADSVCCDFDGVAPDDSTYLHDLVADVADTWPVDRDRIFIAGHANGGYMAYRMACDHADQYAAIVVIAGGTALDDSQCQPTQPVSVVHMHGTGDLEFLYEGGGPFQMSPGSPGAVESTTRWATHDGCGTTRSPAGPAIDLDSIVSGPETTPERFDCPPGVDVELWTMQDTEHLPGMTDTFVPNVWPWLLDHAR